MSIDVGSLREDYRRGTLERGHLLEQPVAQFGVWIKDAIQAKLPEPNAFVLATVDAHGMPNTRVVLLKAYDDKGFVFYTNYESQKAQELMKNPVAAINFNWLEHERQVRIKGSVERVSEDETKAYFHSRPKGSQIGAWASPQSQVISNRDGLEEKKAALEVKYAEQSLVPVPPHWGGFRITPLAFEFWQGRSNRLHDRFRYTLINGDWTIERLAP